MFHHVQPFQLSQGTGVFSRPIIIPLNQNYEITQKGYRRKGWGEGSKHPQNFKIRHYCGGGRSSTYSWINISFLKT